jgi:signal transduction histidine kinase
VVDSFRDSPAGPPPRGRKPGDAACRCDAELTRRIIENLVSNAMKHTPLEAGVGVLVSVPGAG